MHQVVTSDNVQAESPPPPSSSSKLRLLQEHQKESMANSECSTTEITEAPSSPAPIPVASPPSSYCIVFLNEPLSRRISCESEADAVPNGPQNPQDKRIQRTEEELFHRNLRLLKLDSITQVESVLREKIETFKGYYGILQFLYSIILTKVLFTLLTDSLCNFLDVPNLLFKSFRVQQT